MKRAKKSPRKFFTSSEAQIYRVRMRAYLDGTREDFRKTIAEAIQSEKEAHLNAMAGSEHVTPVGGNVFLDLGFPAEVAAQLKKESDALIDRKEQATPNHEIEP